MKATMTQTLPGRSASAALTEQENAWLGQVATRLRLIQADAALATPEQGREFLNEEIARSLKDVAPVERKRYLEALLARFPVGGRVMGIVPPAAAAPTAAPPSRVETFEELVERFFKAVAEADAVKRAELGQRLVQAGLATSSKQGGGVAASGDLKRALGLAPEQELDVQNLIKLSALLLETFQRLDQTALATLRELAPRSSLLKRPQDLRTAASHFLSGQSENFEPYLRAAAGLFGALLAAMLGGGRDFGRQFVERLSPSAIEDVVIGEGGGSSLFGKGKKERCWERYLLLCKDFETADLVDRRMRDCLAAFVERKVLSAR